MKFEEKLMTLRKEKGWSQEDLSNQIGVSRQTISKWESSQTTPELNKLIELSKIFEISIDELVDNLPEEENTEVEKVYAKVNFKPTYIFMGIICLLILIVLIISIFYINQKEKIYIDSIVVTTYEKVLNDKIEITEIHFFDKAKQCLGSGFKIIAINKADQEMILKELSINDKFKVKNLVVEENRITYLTNEYVEFSKNELIEKQKENHEHFSNLEIIDM